MRLENTPDVRDVIKLEFRSCKEWIDKWMMNVEYILNDKWLWMRDLRPLRPENTPDGMDVIELEFRSCKEWIDKWIMNVEYLLNDE